MRHILLIISGSIAAYKSLELIRRGQDRGYGFTCILTAGAQAFITPLSAASLSGNTCYTDLFSLKDETEMGHIRLSREADAIVVSPASADLLAKMAQGRADDLASTVLLATDKPVFAAPAMNHKMWEHTATQRNLKQLAADGVHIIQPDSGSMACGEVGDGRLAEVATILDVLDTHLAPRSSPLAPDSSLPSFLRGDGPLAGKHALVTAGPTQEPIDPVRYLSNHSSGKQGYAIAAALAEAGADVTLVSGPTSLPTPPHVTRINVTTADEMWAACQRALPADIAICAAAVADWKPVEMSSEKIKKRSDPEHGVIPAKAGIHLSSANSKDKMDPGLRRDDRVTLELTETPDILANLAAHTHRPTLLIGFAAETNDLITHARAKLTRKGCDMIVANDISRGVFGADENEVILITPSGDERLPRMSKQEVAKALVDKVAGEVVK